MAISGSRPYPHEALEAARSELAALTGPVSAPTNLKPIAVQLGVTALKRAPLTVTAMLIRSADSYVVLVNRDKTPGEQRFGLAHEIGHLLLNKVDHHISTRHRAPSFRGTHDEIEAACDQLAAEMLMPRTEVIQTAEAFGWQFGAIPAISNHFLVGLESAAARMIQFSPLYHSIVTWRRGALNQLELLHDPRSNLETPQVVGFDSRMSIIDIPSACQAYTQEGTFRGLVPFEVLVDPFAPPVSRYFETESRGFGSGPNRLVRSLANLRN